MGCQIHHSNPHTLFKIPQKKPTHFSPFSSVTIALCSSQHQEPPITITSTLTQSKNEVYRVHFKTLGGCKLGISRYPDFEYNAEGGEGTGAGRKMIGIDFNGETSVDFDVETLRIPPLTSATTRFLGLPLPPFLKIEIAPEILRGIINQISGKVDLKFKAKFWFSIGSIYKAPPLLVETLLTSEETMGTLRGGRGERLDEDGRCKLIGVATVEPIDDLLMNSFLDLPTECLASLNATIAFSSDQRS